MFKHYLKSKLPTGRDVHIDGRRNQKKNLAPGGPIFVPAGRNLADRDQMEKIRQVSEGDLVERLKAGDESAFRDLVETKQGMVYNTVLGLVQQAEDAEDVTQEVFIKVFESIHQFKGESAFSTWLYRISVTTALEFLRRKKRKKRFAFITSLFGEKDGEELGIPDFVHPGVQMDNREKSAILMRAVNKLHENQRIAFSLNKVEGLSYQEVAEVMRLTVSAVESLLHRARQNLKRALEDYYYEDR
jgi:RNA polymerase sigma-70 factor (ECF subfamily)